MAISCSHNEMRQSYIIIWQGLVWLHVTFSFSARDIPLFCTCGTSTTSQGCLLCLLKAHYNRPMPSLLINSLRTLNFHSWASRLMIFSCKIWMALCIGDCKFDSTYCISRHLEGWGKFQYYELEFPYTECDFNNRHYEWCHHFQECD